jgi:uncharacterized protein DUF397
MISAAARQALRRARWRTSSYSQGANNCVEITAVLGWVGIRDSALGDRGPVLAFTVAHRRTMLDALLFRIRAGVPG